MAKEKQSFWCQEELFELVQIVGKLPKDNKLLLLEYIQAIAVKARAQQQITNTYRDAFMDLKSKLSFVKHELAKARWEIDGNLEKLLYESSGPNS